MDTDIINIQYIMNALMAQLAALPTYEIEPLKPDDVMSELQATARKLASEVNPQNLADFNEAQRAATYLIDEIKFHNSIQGGEIHWKVLIISERIFTLLGGAENLTGKPSETEKSAFYKWAICTRHADIEKIAA
jgi:hypothetical protein